MPKIITRFFRYWWESVTNTKEVWDMITWIFAILAWLTVLVSKWIDLSPKKLPIISTPIFENVAFVIAIVLSLRAIFWLPFKRHQKQEVDSIFDKSELRKEIEKLQVQLDDRAKRKANKDMLGIYLEELQIRILAIEKMDFWEYEKSLQDGNDQKSDALAGKIRKFIAENIGLGEASCFGNLSGIKLAKFNDEEAYKPGVMSDMMRKKQAWLHKINHLDHYSIQLKEIIKNYQS